jgi:hypothetical protein
MKSATYNRNRYGTRSQAFPNAAPPQGKPAPGANSGMAPLPSQGSSPSLSATQVEPGSPHFPQAILQREGFYNAASSKVKQSPIHPAHRHMRQKHQRGAPDVLDQNNTGTPFTAPAGNDTAK